ncbi:MAG: hypothetical protein J7K40_05460 [candidate division Zixibacteria bacterium]|nr:hypothetical protein [candidate division Zixibacteria bacterium]
MQRHEIVNKAISDGTPMNVTTGDIVKYWTLEDQERAIKKTEMQIGVMEDATEMVKTLIEHGYPVDFITTETIDADVQIEPPERYHISVTVKLSPKITTMVNNLRGKEYYVAPRKDVVSYLSGVVEVLKGKLAAEKQHLEFLNEDVQYMHSFPLRVEKLHLEFLKASGA